MTPESLLDDIADAILDRKPIDWTTIDANGPPIETALLEQLKTLSTLRHLATASRALDPSGTWGHLRVFERIGQGGYGDVYRAWDTRLDREVALKLLPLDVTGDASPDSTIIEEGRLLARVRHPNVATIYGAERIDGRVGLWMELVKGRTLEQALADGRKFSAAEASRFGVQLCHAVSAVHAAGLLHRDIKSQNVMLDDNGRLVLMDFGTGRELDAAANVQLAGTPLYLAPEVLSGGAATPQSDVYGIGVVVFRLLTGSYPVFGTDLADLRRAHANGERTDARVDRPEIPPRLRHVLARAINSDPHERYASAEAFGEALAGTQRVPAVKRIGYAVAGIAALAALLAAGWHLGLREMFIAPAAASSKARTPTIAVLPFRNASSDLGNDDFVDGLTSEVIRNLAVIDGLEVRSQTSSFMFKDQPRNLREVARQLDVDLVVEANVQRVGNRLRINAQLVRARDDVPVWSNRFDRTLDDVFAIQDEISRAIVDELRLTVARGPRTYQTSPAVYDIYLRGRVKVDRGGVKNAAEAQQLFEQVIAVAPEYAPAYAGLADAYANLSDQIVGGISPEEGLAGMKPAAVRALQLDPLRAEAHAAMAITYARELDWDHARQSFERALELNPSLSHIHTSYAFSTLLPLGETAKALDVLDAALKTDPLSLNVKRSKGLALDVAGRYEEAIAMCREIMAVDPEFEYTANLLARSLTFAGRPAEAIALWKSRHWPGDWERWVMPAYVKTGRRADVARLFDAHRNEEPYRQALLYAAVGDKDRTFEALNRSVDRSPNRTATVLVYPEMALLRGDPRLDLLKKRLKLLR